MDLDKPKLISAGSELSTVKKIFFYSLTVLLGLSIIGSFAEEAPIIVTIAFILLFTVFQIVPLHDFLSAKRVRKAANILNRLIEEVGNGEIRFIKPLKARPITYNSIGRIVWAHGPLYSFSTNITPEGGYRTGNIHRFKNLSYGVVIGKRGEGMLILPGLEFDEPELNNTVLLYIPSKQPLIEALTQKFSFLDECKVEVKIYKGGGLRGEAMLSGKRKASLYLATRFFDEYLKFKLADLKDRTKVNFSAKLFFEKPILIVARKRSSPRAIASDLGRNIMIGDRIPYILLIEFKKGLRKFKSEVELKVLEQAIA